ncbi:hypothetical protein [Burkholderia humptydooensis]|uniref:hypothetical protein n=1 Tax=Burkholderia humptydooensis TaxID=430531 RepID=UPI0010FE9E2C|nr:hypothetical protein [Burkholderia humptydooensis]
MSYTEYKYGVATSSIHLKFEDTTYVKLRSLLDKEKEGWKYDLVTYAPSHVYSSQYVRINCINKKIVVNYQKNGDWVQVSKEIVESCPTPP